MRHIAITLGDPAGIGPEILDRALAETAQMTRARIRVYGHRSFLTQHAKIHVTDVGALSAADVTPGRPTKETARAQVAYLEAAVADAKKGLVSAIVTAPISKAQARSAGFGFPGHTEFLASSFGVKNVAMLFTSPTLRAVLCTVHVPIAKLAQSLTTARIETVMDLSVAALANDFGVKTPRIGVLGLNPHAGEGGMFGDEEARIIQPAIDAAKTRHPQATFEGPLPPDTAFRGKYDLFVAMYHDQALIPVKLDNFEAVNVTLGLPIIRTSPDHGVAYDIAGKGVADHRPMLRALELAVTLDDNRNRS
jgi:4-hydroxythreonine-4-phosphate dehydrogenase